MGVKGAASLQTRLVWLVLGVVSLVWCVAAVLTWVQTRHELDELLDSHLAQGAAMLVAQQGFESEDDDGLVDTPLLHRYAPRVAFQVWHEGKLVMRSANTQSQPLSTRTEGYDTTEVAGEAWRVFAARGHEHDVQVYVGEQLHSRADILWAVMRSLALPMALMLPLLGVAAWAAVRAGLQPLRRLSAVVARRDPLDLQTLALDGAPAELQPLMEALNGLFERVSTLLVSERRFTADAAHELRTPIAGVRAQAQVALAVANDAERRHALEATLQGCDRLARLVEQLLQLSRLEAASPATPVGVVDLIGLARRVAGELAGAALARHQDLALEGEAVRPVQGEETLLGVLLRNLLDNAIRYSPDGARLVLTIQADAAGQVLMVMEDSGPGLDEAQRQRLGERFFRVLGTGQSGSGLGWSIVRRIATAHGLQIAVDRSPALGGLRVTVSGWRQADREG